MFGKRKAAKLSQMNIPINMNKPMGMGQIIPQSFPISLKKSQTTTLLLNFTVQCPH